MKTHYQKDLRILLFALLASASALASLPKVESVWTGMKAVYDEQDFGLRILRKAMLVALASQQGIEKPAGWDGRISGGGRLVWKTQGSTLPACCGAQGKDRRQGTGLR
jgi:hypothetical protein